MPVARAFREAQDAMPCEKGKTPGALVKNVSTELVAPLEIFIILYI
jgi:hypothetical protein